MFEETANGNGRPLLMRWVMTSTGQSWYNSAWSGATSAKALWFAELLAPLAEQFAGANIVSAERFVAEGDLVVVEVRNHSMKKAGTSYPNRYCWVFGDGGW